MEQDDLTPHETERNGQDRANRRWDTDSSGQGVADGSAFAPRVQQLLAALRQPGWVAEDPEIHLLPHIREVCETQGSLWRIERTVFTDGVYEVVLHWQREGANLARLRRDLFGLIGAIAEGVTFVHQKVTPDGIVFETITALLDDQSPFRGHGHLIRFRVVGAAIDKFVSDQSQRVADDQPPKP